MGTVAAPLSESVNRAEAAEPSSCRPRLADSERETKEEGKGANVTESGREKLEDVVMEL